MFENLFGKKKNKKGFNIKSGESVDGLVGIPINAFPEEIRELLKDPIGNKDEIIRRVGKNGIFLVLDMEYEDEEGKKYRQKWKVNIITGEADAIGGDGYLELKSEGGIKWEMKKVK